MVVDVCGDGNGLDLRVGVNGSEKLSRSRAVWKFPNYFKAGFHPQATEGTAHVMFRKLVAN
jgi:hypothetical protein